MAEKTLEERIKILEDIEEIKKVKANYTFYVDNQQPEDLLDLFAENAVCDFRPLLPEKLEGKKNILAFYKDLCPQFMTMSRHHIMNGVIEVDGDTAKGKWYMLAPATFIIPKGETAIWAQVTYEDEFVRVDGKWKIILVTDKQLFLSPYEDGWVKTPEIKI